MLMLTPRIEIIQMSDFTPMMSKITATLGRNFSKSKEFQELQEQDSGLGVDKRLVSMTLKRQDKIGQDIKQRMLEEDEGVSSYTKWLDARPTTNMEKLHFITGETPDCQLCLTSPVQVTGC